MSWVSPLLPRFLLLLLFLLLYPYFIPAELRAYSYDPACQRALAELEGSARDIMTRFRKIFAQTRCIAARVSAANLLAISAQRFTHRCRRPASLRPLRAFRELLPGGAIRTSMSTKLVCVRTGAPWQARDSRMLLGRPGQL